MINIIFEDSKNRSVAFDEETFVGECNFLVTEENINIIHTEVNNNYKGQGIARKLVECVLDNVKKYNKKIIADCSYAKKIIEENNK